MQYVCEFVGGALNGRRIPVEDAARMASGWSKDWSKERARGALVPRADLDNRPTFDGYAGPMWDGTRGDDIGVLRYETWSVYDALSR